MRNFSKIKIWEEVQKSILILEIDFGDGTSWSKLETKVRELRKATFHKIGRLL